jgi:hypothetical protein
VRNGWNVQFRRALGENDFNEWERLVNMLENFKLNGMEDEYMWVLEKFERHSTRSLYRKLTFRGVVNKRMSKLWKKCL